LIAELVIRIQQHIIVFFFYGSVYYIRAVQIPGSRLLSSLIFVRWRLLFLGAKYGALHHPYDA